MKKYYSFIACLICACMLFTAGCGADAPVATTATTTAPTEPTINGAQVYTDAIAPIENAKDLSVQTNIKQTITLGTACFQNVFTQTANYHTAEDGSFTASFSEKLDYNGGDYFREETFVDGKLYARISNIAFLTETDKDGFMARRTPAVLLDPALYSTITVAEDMSSITFTDATAVEPWMAGDEAELVTASGTVQLDVQGVLVSSTYTVSYRIGGTTYDTTVTARICPPDTTTVEIPKDADSYTPVNDLTPMDTVMQVGTYLENAEYLSATHIATTVSQAAAVMLMVSDDIAAYGSGEEHMAKIQQNISYANYSTNEEQQENVTITYRDGTYTVEEPGAEPEVSTDVEVEAVQQYYRSLLSEDLVLVSLFDTYTIHDLDGITMYEFGFDDDTSMLLCQNVCELLFDDGDLLNDLASAYTVNKSTAYLSVDSYTGLPIAYGIMYEACHTIDGVDYLLTHQVDTSIDIASMTSYKTITEDPLPDTEPAEKPTPLLYHVTGTDGQEMWLFGTIHVGDDRTGYLPQKLLDAFDASDALALEIDSASTEDRMETDEELRGQLQAAYYYSDSTTKDHIQDEALYEEALRKIKATGNYFFTADYMQVTAWENLLHQSYLGLGYTLTTEKGLEARLQRRATQQEKPVWEVEDLVEHSSFQSNWSAELQEYILKQTVESSVLEYCASTQELYELWCTGDEAALIEKINEEDTDELTSEELALMEEYNETMIVKRNAEMLEVAKGYLESDDVVFYAVGLGHLLTEDGLVNTLRDAGYKVELVTYD